MAGRYLYAVVVSIILGAAGTLRSGSAAEVLNADDIIAAYGAQKAAIYSWQGKLVTSFTSSESKWDSFRRKDGSILETEFEWAWSGDPARLRRKGRWLAMFNDGKGRYTEVESTFDGALLRSLNESSGKIELLGNFVLEHTTPLILIGDVISDGHRIRTLLDILKSESVRFLGEISDESTAYLGCPLAASQQGEGLYLHAGFSVHHGFSLTSVSIKATPSKSESLLSEFDGRRFVLKCHEFQECLPGVWLPVRGETQTFLQKFRPPKGVTLDEFNALPTDDQIRRASECMVVAEPTGPPRVYEVAVNLQSVNQMMPDSLFTLEFPDGTVVWDDVNQRSLRVGEAASQSGDLLESRVNDGKWWLWYVLSANIFALIVLALIIRLRYAKR